jgi:DNA-binding response OmpR family regulator
VDVFIRRLRHKLEAAGCPPCIETVRGIGYRLLE